MTRRVALRRCVRDMSGENAEPENGEVWAGGIFSSRSDRSGSAKWIRETGEHINQSGGREPSCTYGAQLRNHGLEGILADGEDGR